MKSFPLACLFIAACGRDPVVMTATDSDGSGESAADGESAASFGDESGHAETAETGGVTETGESEESGGDACEETTHGEAHTAIELGDFGLVEVWAGHLWSEASVEVVVTAPWSNTAGEAAGELRIYSSPVGQPQFELVATLYGEGMGEQFGRRFRLADLTGDGSLELLVMAPGELGYLAWFELAPSGAAVELGRWWSPHNPGAMLGGDLELSVDHTRLAIGAPWFSDGSADQGAEGGAFVYAFGPTGVGEELWRREGNGATTQWGAEVELVDVDLDGRTDLVVGSPDDDLGLANNGSIYVFEQDAEGSYIQSWARVGSAEGERVGRHLRARALHGLGGPALMTSIVGDDGEPTLQVFAGEEGDFGDAPVFDLVGGADHALDQAAQTAPLDDDGLIDLVLGAPRPGEDYGTNTLGPGAVLVYSGDEVDSISSEPALLVSGDTHLGVGFAVATADLDGDGNHDVLAAASEVDEAGETPQQVVLLTWLSSECE